MQQIRFLRNFSASRVIKNRFTLKARGDSRSLPEQSFAFNHRLHQFKRDDTVSIKVIQRKELGNLIVVTNDQVAGEVVLDGAQEGTDFEVV